MSQEYAWPAPGREASERREKPAAPAGPLRDIEPALGLAKHRGGVGAFAEQPDFVAKETVRFFSRDRLGIGGDDLQKRARIQVLDGA